jgi:hypothetical protein
MGRADMPGLWLPVAELDVANRCDVRTNAM